MLRPDVGGACKGVVDGAICVGVEAAAVAVVNWHFCAYKRRGLTREKNFFLSLAIKILARTDMCIAEEIYIYIYIY